MSKVEDLMIDFEQPSTNKITIYSKSECINCYKVKDLLNKTGIDFHVINCDAYLVDNKTKIRFLEFIESLSDVPTNTFPMVFDADGKYIGGYTETKEYARSNLVFVF